MTVRDEIDAAFAGSRQLSFSGDESFFQGHFPERPVLPAFVQLMAVRVALENVRQERLEVIDVSRSVFKRPVGPKDVLDLEIKVDGDRCTARIRCQDDEVSIFHFRIRQVESQE
ncbi:MAG: hotdog family protein [Planctomycetota bacterium]|jgi:3-hydroxymyristoyl/3-hydroxydecanoyl-(acyl carrier protein) dehydratase